MSYTPQNEDVFFAAYAGCLAGIQAQSSLNAARSSAYAGSSVIAAAYAEEFDTQWGGDAPDDFECRVIGSLSSAFWLRSVIPASPEAKVPATYAETVEQFIFVIQAGSAELAALSITPGPCDAGGESQALSIVYVNHDGSGGAEASPYTAKPYDWIVFDSSGGAIEIVLPPLTKDQWVSVGQDSGKAFTDAVTVTVDASNVAMDQPPPLNGTFAGSVSWGPATTWTAPGAVGMRLQWYCAGSLATAGLLLE